MTTKNNILKCSKCGLTIISDELGVHQCLKVIDYRIEDKILWLWDGERWYPRKLPTDPNNGIKQLMIQQNPD